ncbi:MAG: hypothetical protein HOW73_39125 [Polyangiaceae bacterium]|nr:hypothetical protein [Polyangiaceae bacterium]
MPALEALSKLTADQLDRVRLQVADSISVLEVERVLSGLGVDESSMLAETLASLAMTARYFDDRQSAEGPKSSRSEGDFLKQLDSELCSRWNEEAFARWKQLSASLRPLLYDGLHVLAKSIRLQYEHTNIFGDAQLVSDIRPVFDRDASRALAAIICHSLRIEYRSEGMTKHITVALDSLDLQKLKDLAERGLKKESTLANWLKAPGAIRAKVPGKDAD